MINPKQLRLLVVRPALQEMAYWSESAEKLLLGTCAQESAMGSYIKQIKGPALGIFQMETSTFLDIKRNYLCASPLRRDLYYNVKTPYELFPPALALVHDLKLAAKMCRVHYLRVKEALPEEDDIPGMANYWKKYYNTEKGKGTIEEFIRNYEKYVK